MIILEKKRKRAVGVQSVQAEPVPPLGTMVKIPGGKFMMGLDGGDESESPCHKVQVNPFLLCVHPVTQGEWISIMEKNPSQFQGERLPVEKVAWYAALVYCNKLSMASGFTPVYSIEGSADPLRWGKVPRVKDSTWDSAVMNLGADGYRLPTEAEWEYAALGGEGGEGVLKSASLSSCAWYAENSGESTHEVMQKSPGPFGLYDMLGNVWEWCWDWFGEYPMAASQNPTGPAFGSGHVRRGGSWSNGASYCREKSRGHSEQGLYPFLGLRLARSVL